MGKRELRTKLILDGEKEYKDQVKSINENMRVLGSELKKVQSGEANLTAQNKVLSQKLDEQKQKIGVLNDALRKAQERYAASEKAVSDLKGQLEKARAEYGENSEEVKKMESALARAEEEYRRNKSSVANWQIQLNNAEAALNQTTKEIDKSRKKLADFSEAWETAGKRMQTVGDVLTKTVSLPIAGAATAAVASMNHVDEGLDTIATKTGATGEAMQEMRSVFEDVASEIPGDFSGVGAAIGEINTRLDFTGEQLNAASRDFLKFAKVNGLDVNSGVQLVTRAMGDAGISAGDYMTVLDSLTVAGQKSGISVDKLAENLAKYGAPLRALGIDTQKAIAMFAGWEKAGVNTEIAFSGMKKAISNWGKEGKDATAEFSKTLEEIKKCPTIAEATSKSIEVFGAKAGPDLADAIQGGRFAFEDYVKALESGSGTVEATYGMVVDEADDAQLAMQQCELALHDIGETVAKTVGPMLKDGAAQVKQMADKFNSLDEKTQKNILKFAAFAAVGGPVIKTLGGVASASGKAVKGFAKVTAKIKEWSSAAKTASTAAQGVSKSAGGIASMLGSGGPVVAAVGVAAAVIGGTLYAAYEKAEEEAQALADGWKAFVDAGNNFAEGVSIARSALEGFNTETLISNEKMQEYEDKITTAREKIHTIAETAAGQSRQLTDTERKEIESLIGMIDSYTSKKLEAYGQQQEVVAAMAAREGEMTKERAQEYYKAAVDTYNDTLSQAQAHRANMYAEAQKQFDDNVITREALEERQNEADAYYAEAEAKAQEHYGKTSETIANAYYEQNLAGNENLERVQEINQRLAELDEELAQNKIGAENRTVEQHKAAYLKANQIESERKKLIEEMTGIMQGSTGEKTACWMQMAADAEQYGGKISEESQATATSVETAFNSLPEKVKQKFSEMMEGAISGIGDKIKSVTNAVGGVVSGVIQTITQGFDIHSPSRVMRKLFGHVMEGGIRSLQERKKDMVAAAQSVIQDTREQMEAMNAIRYSLPIPDCGALQAKTGTAAYIAGRSPVLPATTSPASGSLNSVSASVHITHFYNNRDEDIQALSNKIAANIKRQLMAKGGMPR